MERLSAVYASALFDLFLENAGAEEARADYADTFLEHTVFLRDLLKEGECYKILVHPHISSAEKRTFFETALKDQVNQNLTGLLYLAISKNRETFLVPAYTQLISHIERYQKKAKARVISAKALSESQLTGLSEMLSRKLDKNVVIETVIDPTVIGGIYIYIDGYFIDKTIKTQLRNMKSSIIEGGGM